MNSNRPDHLLVEGPDGAGKTTLIGQLCRDFGYEVKPRFSTSQGGPLDNLQARVIRDLHENAPGVYDRHPFMSEVIYSTALGRKPQISLTHPVMQQQVRAFFRRTPVILCLPPLEVVQENVNADLSNQLSGVAEVTPKLWGLYRNYPMSLPILNFTIYDYTQPEAYYRLREFLYNHTPKENHV